MLPIAALAALLRVETVAILFRAFDAEAVALTASALLAFLIGLLAHAWIALLARAFYAQQDTLTPVIAAVIAVVVNTTLAALLVDPLGLPGIALAIALAAWLETAILLVVFHRRLPAFRFEGVLGVVVRTSIAVALAAVVGAVVHGVAAPALAPDPIGGGIPTIVGLVATMVVVGAVFGGTFLLAAVALRIEELRSIVGLMIDALRRPRRS
jgi:putative peptidoglycan lipid II flippase